MIEICVGHSVLLMEHLLSATVAAQQNADVFQLYQQWRNPKKLIQMWRRNTNGRKKLKQWQRKKLSRDYLLQLMRNRR